MEDLKRVTAWIAAVGVTVVVAATACGSTATSPATSPSPSSSASQAPASSGGAPRKLQTVRFSMNPAFYSYLPMFVALDKGYFKDEGLNVQVHTYTTSAATQIPILARGGLDITDVVSSPALYNQFSSGFDIKLIAATQGCKAGWHDTSWLIVRQDLWKSGAIRRFSDLKGKTVDGAFLGSPDDFVAEEAIAAGGLTLSQVHYTTKEASPGDQVAALINKAVDVQATTEPTATEIQLKGYGHEWESSCQVVPTYQSSMLAVSAAFLKSNPGAVARFLAAYLRAVHVVDASNGKWTLYLAQETAKWTQFPLATVEAIPGPTYPGTNGEIDVPSLEQVQRLWVQRGMVKHPVPVGKMVDTAILKQAQRLLARRGAAG